MYHHFVTLDDDCNGSLEVLFHVGVNNKGSSLRCGLCCGNCF